MSVSLSYWLDVWPSLTVLVIGDVILDCYLMGTADRLCQEAPVPVVAIANQQHFPGGAANVAANVASLGAQTCLISVIGQDEAASHLRSSLHHYQVSTDTLISHAQRSTLTKQRVIANTQLVVRFDQGSTDPLPKELETQVIQTLIEQFYKCDLIIISDYCYGIITPQILHTLNLLQQEARKTLIIDSKQLAVYQMLNASAVKPNYAEALKLLGLAPTSGDRVQQLIPHTSTLLQLTGADRVAVTLDRDGVLMLERNQPPWHQPTRPAPTHHTSGAGDTFISALALALAAHAPTATATEIATMATTVAVAQPGTSVCPVATLRQVIEQSFMTRHSHAHPPSPIPLYDLEHR